MKCANCKINPRVKSNSYCASCKREYQRRNDISISPEMKMLKSARSRARKKDLSFDLDIGDIFIPEQCPVLLIPLHKGKGKASDNSPSLDRIIPKKGYVKGNVTVISTRANRIKSNATYKELNKVSCWLEGLALNLA